MTLRLGAPGLAAAFCLVFLSVVTELTATLLLIPTGAQTLSSQFWGVREQPVVRPGRPVRPGDDRHRRGPELRARPVLQPLRLLDAVGLAGLGGRYPHQLSGGQQLRGGKIAQCAAPLDLYTQPANPEMATFVGEANLVDGVLGGDAVETILGSLPVHSGTRAALSPGPVTVLVCLTHCRPVET